jgi:hypothetical protein
MDEKSASSSSVKVLPTPKSRETIPHSIQIYKPPHKTDAEMYSEAMGLHDLILQQERERKGDDTHPVDESTQDLAEKVYLHLQLHLVQPTGSIDDYLVQTGLIERPYREVSVKPVKNYESLPYRPTKVKGKFLEPRKPAVFRNSFSYLHFNLAILVRTYPHSNHFRLRGKRLEMMMILEKKLINCLSLRRKVHQDR